MRRIMFGAVMAGALSGAMLSPASAFDLTGTWQGRQVCKILTAGGKREEQVFQKDVIAVTQVGDEVRILMKSVNLLYSGLGFTDATDHDKGEVAFRLCGLSDDPTTKGEMGRAEVSTAPFPPGSKFKATSFFTTADEVDTCGWNYRRIATGDPGVPPCP
ncbi:MAG TPA: hypothetical protein VKJ47_20585 [Candidatus Binatia bacterium]|nr:hypothetical protein [Candidatus Binatia bacterium]